MNGREFKLLIVGEDKDKDKDNQNSSILKLFCVQPTNLTII